MQRGTTPQQSTTRPLAAGNGQRSSSAPVILRSHKRTASLGDDTLEQPPTRKRRGSTGHITIVPTPRATSLPLALAFGPGYAAHHFMKQAENFLGCGGKRRLSQMAPCGGGKKTPKKPYPRKALPRLSQSAKKAEKNKLACGEKKPPVSERELHMPVPASSLRGPPLMAEIIPNHRGLTETPESLLVSQDGMNEYWEKGQREAQCRKEANVSSGVDVLNKTFEITMEAMPCEYKEPEDDGTAKDEQASLSKVISQQILSARDDRHQHVNNNGLSPIISPLGVYKAIEKCLNPDNRENHVLVGRERELSDLVNTIQEMFDRDEFSVIWVSGGPGSGKFSLIHEIFSEDGCKRYLPNHREATLDYQNSSSLLVLAERLFPEEDLDLLTLMDELEIIVFFQLRTKCAATPLVIHVEVAPGLQQSQPAWRLLRAFLNLPAMGCKILFIVKDRYGPRRILEWHSERTRPRVVHLPPYTKFQLLAMFRARIPAKLKPRAAMVLPMRVVNHIAGMVARLDGDCRKFLSMCQLSVKKKVCELSYDAFAVAHATGAMDPTMDANPLTLFDSADIAGVVIGRYIKRQWINAATPFAFTHLLRSAPAFACHLAGLAMFMAANASQFTLAAVANYFSSLSRSAGFERGISTNPRDVLLLCWPLERKGVVAFFGTGVNQSNQPLPLVHQTSAFVRFTVLCPSGLQVFTRHILWLELISSVPPPEEVSDSES